MQIVIDIPEEEYNLIKMKLESNIGGVSSEAERVIAKGTPLPKGHGKLIDSNVLWDAFHDLGQDFYEAFDFAEANAVMEADKEGQDETK
jgi:hypothetical protein